MISIPAETKLNVSGSLLRKAAILPIKLGAVITNTIIAYIFCFIKIQVTMSAIKSTNPTMKLCLSLNSKETIDRIFFNNQATKNHP